MSASTVRTCKTDANCVYCVDLHPGGSEDDDWKVLAYGGGNDCIELYDWTTGQRIRQCAGHTRAVCSVAFHRAEEHRAVLASGSYDGTIKIWDWTTGGAAARTMTNDGGAVFGVAFHPDPDTHPDVLASCGEGGRVQIWDWTTGRQTREMRHGGGRVFCLAFHPGQDHGHVLATGDDQEKSVCIWDWTSGERTRALAGHGGSVYCLAFHPHPDWGHLLASGGASDHYIKLWNWQAGACQATISGNRQRVSSVQFHPYKPDTLLSAHGDQHVVEWTLANQQGTGAREAQAMAGHGGWVHCLKFAGPRCGPGHYGKAFVSGSQDGSVRVWEHTGFPAPPPPPVEPGAALAFHPSPERAGVLGYAAPLRDGAAAVVIADWQRKADVRRLAGHTGAVRALAFQPAPGRATNVLASGADDGTVKIWDADADEPAAQCVRTLVGHAEGVTAVAFHPGAARGVHASVLASGSADGTVRLWDWTAAAAAATPGPGPGGAAVLGHGLEGHGAGVTCVAFHPGLAHDTVLASGSADGTVKIWSWDTAALRHTLEHPGGAVLSVAFRPGEAPRSSVLATGSNNGEVRLWNWAEASCLATLAPRAGPVRTMLFHPTQPDVLLTGHPGRAAGLIEWKLDAGAGDAGSAAETRRRPCPHPRRAAHGLAVHPSPAHSDVLAWAAAAPAADGDDGLGFAVESVAAWAPAPRPETLDDFVRAATAELDASRAEHQATETAHAAVVQRAEERVAAAQARLDAAHRAQAETCEASAARVAAAEAKLAKTKEDTVGFRRKVVADGIDELDVPGVYQLLRLLGVTTVAVATLEAEQVTGAVLPDLTESEMEDVFKIAKLGDRRRLTVTLARLSHGQGFLPEAKSQPGALAWSVDDVAQWLRTEKMGAIEASFVEHAVDGVCLLEIGRDDLPTLGVTIMGQKSALMRKIDKLKKQTYAGAAISPDGTGGGGGGGGDGAAAAAAGRPATTESLRAVLDAVLEQNSSLRKQIAESKGRLHDAVDVPDQFVCAITSSVMDDPVMAMDGHTYERAAIEAWFQRSDTSPMTNLVIPPTLVPNVALRQMIAALHTKADKARAE